MWARLGFALVFLMLYSPCFGQSSAQASQSAVAPQVSPEAAYEQSLHPLDVVRKSMDNWSDSELAAFSVGVKIAGEACRERTPEQFIGDDLIAYARLCSLAQNWPVMGAAAARYIDSTDAAKPQLATAYGYKLESALRAQDEPQILAVERAMLAAVPRGQAQHAKPSRLY